MTKYGNREEIARMLQECRTIAVVGLSSDPGRASHDVSAYMQKRVLSQ